MRALPSRLKRALAALLLGGLIAPPLAAQATDPAQLPSSTPTSPACPPQAGAPTAQQMQAALAQARDRGALWRVSRDGRVSWLYGTLHVGKLEWVMPGPRVVQALRESDAVALEIDVGDPATQAELAQPLPGAAVVLPPALEQRLARQRAAACLPAGALAQFHPMLQVVALSNLEARWIGLDPGFGIEFMLAGFARSRALPVIALETVASQMQALLPSREDEAMAELEAALSQLESGLSRRVTTRLAQAWAEGDLATLARYEDWCECIGNDADRAQMHRLNDSRNPHLADRIAALHGEGRRLFAAVGLLHMTGAQALPALLAERGFTVERVDLR